MSDVSGARRLLNKEIMASPQTVSLWRWLAWHLVSNVAPALPKSKKKELQRVSGAAISCARAAITLAQSGAAQEATPRYAAQDSAQLVLAHMRCPALRVRAGKEAQRLVLMQP